MQNSLWINSCAFFLFLAIGQGQNLNQSRQNQRKVFQDVNNNQLLIWTCYFYFRSLKSVKYWDLDYDSHEKREYSVAGSLYWVLFPAELEFAKIPEPRLPQNTWNVKIECAGKSKQLYSLCRQLLLALICLHFIVLILIRFRWLYLVWTIQYMVAPLREQLQE